MRIRPTWTSSRPATSVGSGLVGDALDAFGEQCDQLKIHPNVTRHLHAAAEAVSDQGERYKSARETFRTVYEPYLEPPEKMPELRFFENSETAA